MGHTRQQYEDHIRARLGDLGVVQHISETSIPSALEAALATFSRDRPATRTHLFDGDGSTRTFDLLTGTAWQPGWSRLVRVEHPVGSIPPDLIDSQYWYTDETETTATLTLHEAPATGSDNLRITYLSTWPTPGDDPDTDTIPPLYFPAVCAKAAGEIARSKAVEYARQQSTSVAGDLYQRDASSLFEAARLLDKEYETTVLGRPDTPESAPNIGMAVIDVDVFPASLYHRRADYISDEALGG